jgi:hypothetical protein
MSRRISLQLIFCVLCSCFFKERASRRVGVKEIVVGFGAKI